VTHVRGILVLAVLLAFAPPTTAQQTPPEGAAPDYPAVLQAIFAGHTEKVRCVAIGANGKFVASGGDDRTARLWDTKTGKERHVLRQEGDVYAVAFSADGKKLVTGNSQNLVVLWDVETGERRATLRGIREPIDQVAFDGDAKTVAAAGGECGILWDAEKVTQKITFNGRFAPSPDGTMLALCRVHGSIDLWDVATDKPKIALEGHQGGAFALAFAPDGKTLASGGYGGGMQGGSGDKSIKLWEVATGKKLATLVGHSKGIYSLTFAPDGKTLVAADFNGSMKLWDLNQGTVKATLEKVKRGGELRGMPIGCWAIASDLKHCAAGTDHEVQWLDIADFTGASGAPTAD
jgi:WD40 repeat protein